MSAAGCQTGTPVLCHAHNGTPEHTAGIGFVLGRVTSEAPVAVGLCVLTSGASRQAERRHSLSSLWGQWISTSYCWEGKGRYGAFLLRISVWVAGNAVWSLDSMRHIWVLLRWSFIKRCYYQVYLRFTIIFGKIRLHVNYWICVCFNHRNVLKIST